MNHSIRPRRVLLALAACASIVGCDDGGTSATADAHPTPADSGATPDTGADCPPGTADCPCDTGDTCGAGLECAASLCVPETEPPCDPGTQGCACADGLCAGGLECTAEVCVPAGCTPGQANCACDDGACDTDLACNDGVCGMDGPAPDDAITVTGEDIRGCDVLFREGQLTVDRVEFKDGLIGEWMRRDGLLAMAFVGPGGAVVDGVGAIVLSNAQIAREDDLELLEHTCFNANGEAVAGAAVEFK